MPKELFIWWAIGYVVFFVSIRIVCYLQKEKWTLKDIAYSFLYSVLSWFGVIILIAVATSEWMKKIKINWDKEVKW